MASFRSRTIRPFVAAMATTVISCGGGGGGAGAGSSSSRDQGGLQPTTIAASSSTAAALGVVTWEVDPSSAPGLTVDGRNKDGQHVAGVAVNQSAPDAQHVTATVDVSGSFGTANLRVALDATNPAQTSARIVSNSLTGNDKAEQVAHLALADLKAALPPNSSASLGSATIRFQDDDLLVAHTAGLMAQNAACVATQTVIVDLVDGCAPMWQAASSATATDAQKQDGAHCDDALNAVTNQVKDACKS
jgi:hypothetical protein